MCKCINNKEGFSQEYSMIYIRKSFTKIRITLFNIKIPKLLILVFLISFINGLGQNNIKPEPTFKEISYGSHKINVLDFWKAKSETSTPLVVFIHGGGFQALSKEKLKASHLNELLNAGISVAAINYRLAPANPLPAAYYDAKRALQFLRSKSDEWNIDTSKIGAFGGSAGAMISMWLAFHKDMADFTSNDTILHESTKLKCVATMGGQITFDRRWMEISIPGGFIHNNPGFLRIFNVNSLDELNKTEIQNLIKELSPITHLSADDPPIYMEYDMALDSPVPTDKTKQKPWALHHVIFGYTLKARMGGLGIESDLNCPGTKSKYKSITEFFISKLK